MVRRHDWKVPWLPDEQNGYLTSEMVLEPENAMVESLISLDGRTWDVDIVMSSVMKETRHLYIK